MHSQFTALRAIEQLDRALAATEDRPLLLFKHSYTCGVSAEALDELVAHRRQGATDIDYAVVTVQTHRDVSNAVTSRLGVRHETPQALLIRKGRVVWSASHFRVTARAVDEALHRCRERSSAP
jgi:bacillithiol system protein YtxJ